MHRVVLFWFLSLLTASFCYWMPTNAQEKKRLQDASSLFDNLSESDKEFETLKRDASLDLDEDVQPHRRKLDEAADENTGLQLMRRILDQIHSNAYKKKRACQFNLGGHCSTESAAFIADNWHYLDSPLSPGRKRSLRAAGITRKLVQEKLFSDKDTDKV